MRPIADKIIYYVARFKMAVAVTGEEVVVSANGLFVVS